jgi:hypothetical protein
VVVVVTMMMKVMMIMMTLVRQLLGPWWSSHIYGYSGIGLAKLIEKPVRVTVTYRAGLQRSVIAQ